MTRPPSRASSFDKSPREQEAWEDIKHVLNPEDVKRYGVSKNEARVREVDNLNYVA